MAQRSSGGHVIFRLLFIGVIAAASLAMTGCYARGRVRATAHVPASGVVVYSAPPQRRVVVHAPPPAPYHGAVWVEGHWQWNGAQYIWLDGHYMQPRAGYVYVQPRWERRGSGYIYVQGDWRPHARGTVHVQSRRQTTVRVRPPRGQVRVNARPPRVRGRARVRVR
jgi:hypothetical protein